MGIQRLARAAVRPGPGDTSRERASKETNERGTTREAPAENALQTKTIVPLELRTSDRIPGGEAFEERLMGFSTADVVKV